MPNPKNPRDVHVSVILNSETPGDFRIVPNPPGSLPVGPNGELIFKNAGHPGFFVHFDLQDNTGLNYKFPPQPKINQAVWSEVGVDECPQPGKMEVFDPRNISNQDMTLVVHNPNDSPAQGKFYYMLRVTKDGGTTFLELDPGGENQNGPISRFEWNYTLVFIAGAIAGTLATLGGQALLRG